MRKWFEEVKNDPSNIISSRVRLSRNWEEYKFPSRLEPEEARTMIGRIREELSGLPEEAGKKFRYMDLEKLEELGRSALRERRVLNTTLVGKKTPGGIILSEDETACLVLNGDDHFRLQVMAPGLKLEDCCREADKLDDIINEKISYAFSPKYGYLTSYPTNVGTGMKASVVVHLPSLSLSRKFQGLLGDMSRFGTTVRGVFGQGAENPGNLYEVLNQKTLGVSEAEILELVTNVAVQLAGQETEVRQKALEKHRLIREDEVYKSYGVLKYARRLAMKDAMTFLSHLMAGMADGLLAVREPFGVYRVMLGIQPASLQEMSSRPLGKDELDSARAAYIREQLPELA